MQRETTDETRVAFFWCVLLVSENGVWTHPKIVLSFF